MRARSSVNNTVDISNLLEKFKAKYKNIYIYQFEEQVFIYHSIGRKDYKELVLNDAFNEEDKEETLCSKCVIYPENYDFENCEEAGLPTKLAEEIIKNSYLSKDHRDQVLAYYRNEMEDADNQINCLIMAAFPTLNLEEIENWDVATAAKYLSRAEWMLHNINGVPLREPDPSTTYVGAQEQPQQTYNARTSEITDDDLLGPDAIKSSSSKKTVSHNGKPKLTPEKLRELQAKYPEIDWTHDEVSMHGVDGITNQPIVDTTPAALRPRNKLGV